MIEKKCPLKLCFFMLKSCYTVRSAVAGNGFGLGEVWEFEKLLFKFSTIFNRIPKVEPTSVRPYFAKPLLAEVYFWGFKKSIPVIVKEKN